VTDSSGKRIVAHRGFTSRFRELLERSPGKVFFLKDLMDELGAQSEDLIRNTAARAVREGNGAYQVHIASRAWIYRPDGRTNGPSAPQTSRRMFEELAVTREGALLIQGEDGTIYRAVEIS